MPDDVDLAATGQNGKVNNWGKFDSNRGTKGKNAKPTQTPLSTPIALTPAQQAQIAIIQKAAGLQPTGHLDEATVAYAKAHYNTSGSGSGGKKKSKKSSSKSKSSKSSKTRSTSKKQEAKYKAEKKKLQESVTKARKKAAQRLTQQQRRIRVQESQVRDAKPGYTPAGGALPVATSTKSQISTIRANNARRIAHRRALVKALTEHEKRVKRNRERRKSARRR